MMFSAICFLVAIACVAIALKLGQSDGVERCASCRYFYAGWNECRRHAPIAITKPQVVRIWPTMSPYHDWCGDYARKEPDAPA